MLERIVRLDKAAGDLNLVIQYATEQISREFLEWVFGWWYILPLIEKYRNYQVKELQTMRCLLLEERQFMIDRYYYVY